MTKKYIYKKLVLFYKLCRLDKPTGYLLSFFPAAYGVIIANNNKLPIFLTIVFFIGSIITRSAGCIINDIADKDFDKNVFRSRNRPLASKALKVKESLMILFILLCLSLLILLTLSKTAIYIGCFGFILICIYPFMKRFTYFPQVFLGITFNIGALIGYGAIKDTLNLQSMVLYIATCFWTMGYDTIYGFMDLHDDKKIGIKSMSMFLEKKNYKLYLIIFYIIFIILFIFAADIINNNQTYVNIYHYILLIVSCILLYIQVYSLDIKSLDNCMYNFKINNYIGIVLLLYLLR